MGTSRFVYLDGIRGLAALFVLTLHTPQFWHHEFFRGYLAVDIFFVLSGFVIANAYDEKLENKILNPKSFMLTRLVRLYPVYLISIFLTSIFLIKWSLSDKIGHPSEINALEVVLLSIFFLPNKLPGLNGLFPINGPVWSLLFELLVNFIYSVLRPILNDKTLIGIVSIAWGALVAATLLNGGINNGSNWGWVSLFVGISRSTYGIFLGLLLHRWRFKFYKIHNIGISPWYSLLLVGMILGSPSFGVLDKYIDIMLVTFFIPFLVVMAAHDVPTKFEKMLLILGVASYPIYVLQVPIGHIVNKLLPGGAGLYAPVSGFGLVVVLICSSIFIENYYDLPFRKYLKRKLIN